MIKEFNRSKSQVSLGPRLLYFGLAHQLIAIESDYISFLKVLNSGQWCGCSQS